MKETFGDAIEINRNLLRHNRRVAYFFIDPLLDSFEAANQFYFGVLECELISKLNTYKSGASPIQALSDAKELIDHDLYDAVFIFGHEPLLSNKINSRKDEVKKAMDIFKEKSLIECYNLLSHQLSKEIGLTPSQFTEISDKLYENYKKTFTQNVGVEVPYNRGRVLSDLNADLFKMSDSANPNIDFAGGILVANEQTAKLLEVEKQNKIKVASAKYYMIEGSPQHISAIVGSRNHIFPHLRKAFLEAQEEAKINIGEEYKRKNALLEVYTCYPPVPIAFLLATEIIKDTEELIDFLANNEITITGGLNFARAPWNNPVLNALVDMYQRMTKETVKYSVIHGNGGIGEVQGIAVLERG